MAQCFLFFVAGFDTTSITLSFLGYELTTNPDVQQKAYEEIAEMNRQLNGRPIDYDNLQKMHYMDMVISETLRMWPPAGVTDRICVKDYEYNDGTMKFTFKKDNFFGYQFMVYIEMKIIFQIQINFTRKDLMMSIRIVLYRVLIYRLELDREIVLVCIICGLRDI